MDSIGFKNFRKFADFPSIDLAPITILVGANNAGKSTVIKGIIALSDFIKRPYYATYNFGPYPVHEYDLEKESDYKEFEVKLSQNTLKNIKFFFNTSYLAHIGTFKRALYNKAKENAITFQTRINRIGFSYTVKGNPHDEEAVSGNISIVNVFLEIFNVNLRFDLENDNVKVTFNPNNHFKPLGDIFTNMLGTYFSSFDKPISFDFAISSYWYLNKDDFTMSLVESVLTAINATVNPICASSNNLRELNDLRQKRRRYGDDKPLNLPIETIEFLKSITKIFNLGNNMFYFPGHSTRYDFHRSLNIEYLYAHAVTQTIIYSAKDTNDYLSLTIHQFATQKEKDYKRDFIRKWMKEFEIGKDYKIKSVGGEAHIVHIINNDGEEVNLADKGMGAIQLMVLLFRLAISLPSETLEDAASFSYAFANSSIIIIEEPEQNLHPMLQSKLADLFFELFTSYAYRFIIETHSEYLIRRTQVIVGEYLDTEEKLKHNPFKVYYFPTDGAPYDMGYTTTGQFEKKFGDGFINEAGKLHMAVLQNAKKHD